MSKILILKTTGMELGLLKADFTASTPLIKILADNSNSWKTIAGGGGAGQQLLIDPGKYTAFLVTATSNNNILGFTLLIDAVPIGASQSSMGNYDVTVDWGDGTQSKYTDTTIVSKATGDNQAVWKDLSMVYYKHTFAQQRMDVSYKHTYTTPGTYKVKVLGTSYYQLRHTSSVPNIVSRCFEYDLPVYSGITRMLGIFTKSSNLVKINCPSNYQWPSNLIDASQLFDSCPNLLLVGDIVLPLSVVSLRRAFLGTKLKKGIYIPDGVLNATGMYTNCTLLVYAPNTGKNTRVILAMFSGCTKLRAVDGYISKLMRYAKGAFSQTVSLLNTPKFETGIVWIASDSATDLCWKDSGDTYVPATAINNMFYNSGIINMPLNLGTCKASSNVKCDYMFYGCSNLVLLPALPLGAVSCISTFHGCTSAVALHRNSTTGYLDTIPSTVTDMTSTFYNCYQLNQVLPIPNNVTKLANCFYSCYSLQDTGNIFSGTYTALTNLLSMFAHCHNLVIFSSKIPATVTNMHSMFAHCHNLKKMLYAYDWLSSAQSVTDFGYAFYYCSSLINLYGTIPNSVTNADNAFNGCNTAITLPTFHYDNNSACTSVSNMYNACLNLTSTVRLPKCVLNAASFCYNCNKLLIKITTLLPAALTTSKSVNVANMFTNCQCIYGSLTLINTIGNRLWNSGKTFLNISSVFSGCSDLIRIYIPTTWGGLKAV